MGYTRNGCMYCGFGVHMEPKGANRYQKLKKRTQFNTIILSTTLEKLWLILRYKLLKLLYTMLPTTENNKNIKRY